MKVIYWDTADSPPGGKGKREKTAVLPFSGLTVRAIILRRSDSAVLGALHRPDGRYALPGGSFKNGESAPGALTRELAEEGIRLLGLDPDWPEYLGVDYYQGYNQLSLWYLLPVDDVELEGSEELVEVSWVDPDRDPWYPQLKSRILSLIQQHFPPGLSGG